GPATLSAGTPVGWPGARGPRGTARGVRREAVHGMVGDDEHAVRTHGEGVLDLLPGEHPGGDSPAPGIDRADQTLARDEPVASRPVGQYRGHRIAAGDRGREVVHALEAEPGIVVRDHLEAARRRAEHGAVPLVEVEIDASRGVA